MFVVDPMKLFAGLNDRPGASELCRRLAGEVHEALPLAAPAGKVHEHNMCIHLVAELNGLADFLASPEAHDLPDVFESGDPVTADEAGDAIVGAVSNSRVDVMLIGSFAEGLAARYGALSEVTGDTAGRVALRFSLVGHFATMARTVVLGNMT